jgi:hypothetical protein
LRKVYRGNPASAGTLSTHSRYRALLYREERYNRRFGPELVIRKKKVSYYDDREEVTDDPWALEPGKQYRGSQLEAMADQLLREDARMEVCRQCDGRGEETGVVEVVPQEATDAQGNPLVLEFKQLGCEKGHTWWPGEGQVRGIGGDNPILFEEHLAARRRREIYTTAGTPDPEIVSGIYNRVHPQGRKVNSEEQRRKNGASFYR